MTEPTAIRTQQRELPHGIALNCRVAGPEHGPLVVFLHGFPEAAFVWDDLLQHFAQPAHGGRRCVAPNLRGYEHSSAPPDVASYRAKHLVQDIQALIEAEASAAGRPGEPITLVAHDWGGALAWALAAQHPHLLKRLTIVNAPHPATFLRELQQSAAQQAASAYMNFLARPDAPGRLAEDGYRRLFEFFDNMGASAGPHAWLTPALRERYRQTWALGLSGPCHYYGASPLRPATPTDAAAQAVQLPPGLAQVNVPTQVIWGMGDTALPPALLDGLEQWVPHLRVDRVPDATHWIVHEQPQRVAGLVEDFILNS
jgi:pimeloyl-ACP methyl ester carboxylesterase